MSSIANLVFFVSVLETYIYFIGTDINQESDEVTSYCLASGTWTDKPKLNVARKNHSACCLGAYLYVACGTGDGADYLEDSVERLDIVGTSQGAKWELLKLANRMINNRIRFLFSPLNEEELILLGGLEEDEPLGTVEIFNTRTLTVRQAVPGRKSEFSFFVSGNLIKKIARNTVIGSAFTTNSAIEIL